MAGTKIEYRANGGKAHGYLAKPQGAGNGKGVIVVQEWWGLVPHIEDIADRFAKEGYVALAPDLWDGKKATSPDEAGRMLMALDIDGARKKLVGASAALHENGAQGKLGIVGFCMGGQLALYTACAAPAEIGACVDFYGIHPKVTPDLAALAAPVLLIIGEHDASVTPKQGEELAGRIKAAGKNVELHVYPAGHAFFNDTRPEAYDEKSAKDAWQKTLAFLSTNLTG
jgi:carboxymethylenebutenolidase